MMFTERELAYLASQRLGRLATAQPDGTLQASPVGFAYNARLGTVDIGGHDMATSQKFRNVRAGSRVALVVDDIASIQPWRVRCIEIRGDAEALTDPEGSAARIHGPIIRIHPRRIISFGVRPRQPARGQARRHHAADAALIHAAAGGAGCALRPTAPAPARAHSLKLVRDPWAWPRKACSGPRGTGS